MKFAEQLEKDRERLLQELSASENPEQMEKILREELERLLFHYNETAESAVLEKEAARLTGTAGQALTFLRVRQDATLWESSMEEHPPEHGSFRMLLLMLSGAVLGAASLFLTARQEDGAYLFRGAPYSVVLLILGLLFFAAAGWLSGRRQKKRSAGVRRETRKVEVHADPEQTLQAFRTVVLVIDQQLQELSETLHYTEARGAGTAGNIETSSADAAAPALSRQELELCAGLLEAWYAHDGQFALDRIGDVKFFLHQNGVETVNYSEDRREMFDRMPGKDAMTIRPALVWNGVLLKRGAAVGPVV